MPSVTDRRILIVDDNPAIHEDFRKILSRGGETSSFLNATSQTLFGEAPQADSEDYQVDFALQGEEGFQRVCQARSEGQPYMVAFIDVRMPPGWDGVETIERIREVDPELQIVLCTAYSDYSVEEIVQRFGPTDRLLMLKKPFDVAEAHLMALALSEKWTLSKATEQIIEHKSNQVEGVERVMQVVQSSFNQLSNQHSELRERSRQLSDQLQHQAVAILGTREVAAFALAQLAESRDPETGEHLQRMRAFSQVVAKSLATSGPYADQIDQEYLETFYQSSPLHDIGKVGIPDSILLKPGKLTREEFEVMKRHTLIGALALERAARHCPYGSFLRMSADIARCHHERFDGKGYPSGMLGTDIPLSARIVSVADVFDALTSRRVYKDALSVEDSRQIIKNGAGTQFDPAVTAAFLSCFDQIVEMGIAINENGALPSLTEAAALEQFELETQESPATS